MDLALGGQLDFQFFHAWFNGLFLASALLSIAAFWWQYSQVGPWVTCWEIGPPGTHMGSLLMCTWMEIISSLWQYCSPTLHPTDPHLFLRILSTFSLLSSLPTSLGLCSP